MQKCCNEIEVNIKKERINIKGKDIIKIIEENNLENFEIQVSFIDGFNPFPTIKSLKLKDISDVGRSDKVAYIDGELTN